jgi:hypothetical protein
MGKNVLNSRADGVEMNCWDSCLRNLSKDTVLLNTNNVKLRMEKPDKYTEVKYIKLIRIKKEGRFCGVQSLRCFNFTSSE